MTIETWVLDHPEHGRIEVRAGFDSDFLALDPSWPGMTDAGKVGVRPDADASLSARARARMQNPPMRMEFLVDAAVQQQYDAVESGRFPLYGEGAKETLSPTISLGVDREKPHLKITANAFKDILAIDYREGSTVVEFDPPAGSRGAKRRDTMASSSLKRTLIPIAEGLGKGGWALAVVLLGPLVGRLLNWLLGFLPDWQLPDITLPHADLPVPKLPQTALPTPNIPFPEITLPQLPEWVGWLAEYSKVWVPVVIGIVVGIVALRNHKRSEAEKARWNAPRGEAPEER
ncbi:hypothetical protein V6D40_00715 [Corynebacterium sp. Q4381]|uniref:hypothetical protein n=1 Tax=Corynebacterium sp. Marseille-Q4381 TaxID=3121597 RepID=UPI002FE53090